MKRLLVASIVFALAAPAFRPKTTALNDVSSLRARLIARTL